MDVDVSELATIGAEIVELGAELKELRAKRDELQLRITEAETKLTPLLVKHSKIIAGIAGMALPQVPTPSPVHHVNGGTHIAPNGPGGPPEARAQVKARIIRFLENAEPGTSAADIANELRLDPIVVRDIMREMRERNS